MGSKALLSRFWVAAQFALILMMCLRFSRARIGLMSVLLALLAAGCAFWVLRHNRPGNFRIRPEPKDGARLITSGPYRWVRHPMYLSLLLGMASVANAGDDLPGAWGLWGGLLVVLYFKSSLEERLLIERWPEYRSYRSCTPRFIPLPPGWTAAKRP